MGKLVECKTCKHKIAPSAKTCPNCGVKNPGIKGWQGCLGIIVFAVLFAAFMGADKKPLTVEEQQQEAKTKQDNAEFICTNSATAQVMAKEFVKKSLKAPSTADFPFLADSVVYLGDCTHVVKSHVDAQNSFGAMIRTETTVKLRYDKATDNWFIVDDTAAPITNNTKKANSDLTQAVPTANDKKPENTQEKLTDKNINQFLFKFAANYFSHTTKLMEGFGRYKENNNYQDFVSFKNKVWLPDFERDRRLYDEVLESNRKYLFDNNMTFIFSQFNALFIYSNNLFYDLRRGDKSFREDTAKKIKSDMLDLQKLFKERHIDINDATKKP